MRPLVSFSSFLPMLIDGFDGRIAERVHVGGLPDLLLLRLRRRCAASDGGRDRGDEMRRNALNPPLIRFVSHHTTVAIDVKTMRIRPLAADAKLSRGLFEQLAEQIKSGRLAPGARLPTEQELTRAARVSPHGGARGGGRVARRGAGHHAAGRGRIRLGRAAARAVSHRARAHAVARRHPECDGAAPGRGDRIRRPRRRARLASRR